MYDLYLLFFNLEYWNYHIMKQGVNSPVKNIQSRTYDNFKFQHKIYIIFVQFK